MPGPHTLAETEKAAEERLKGLQVNMSALAVTSNLFRASNAVRNHMERTVLAESNLTWTAFQVLWIAWIWGSAETRIIAEESGVSKATLSGVLNTLETRRLIKRTKSKSDGRLVIVALTKSGNQLIQQLFPRFNQEEELVCSQLGLSDQQIVAGYLRKIFEAVAQD